MKNIYLFIIAFSIATNSFAQTYNMTNGSIVTDLASFYDSGGNSGNYANSESLVMTFTPATVGVIKCNFKSFSTESSYDKLYVYDGANINAPQVAGSPFSGTLNSISVVATNFSGALTFKFTSDGSANYAGWSADIINCPIPLIASISSFNGLPGSNITITGNNFTGTTSVSFAGIPATSFTVLSPTSINATVPSGPSGTSGNVTIENSYGTGMFPGFYFIQQDVSNVTITNSINISSLKATLQLSARTNGVDQSVTWSIPNTNIATLSGNTLQATGNAIGKVTITATATNGVSQSQDIYIKNQLSTTVLSVAPLGVGTNADPYKIISLSNLYWLMQNQSSWSSNFVQLANIDASETIEWDYGNGFLPVGNSTTTFTGKYDGQNHYINGLSIIRPTSNNVGLFGYTSGVRVTNLGLTNCNITGSKNVGSLIGYQQSSSTSVYDTVRNCYSSGTVYGTNFVGGLIGGCNNLYVFRCFSSSNVTSYISNIGGTNLSSMAGGLIGGNDYALSYSNIIVSCYATGPISCSTYGGGLIGGNFNNSSIRNCFARGSTLNSYYFAGLVGTDGLKSASYGQPQNSNCYATGKVTGGNALTGSTYLKNQFVNCVWNTETSGASGGCSNYNNGGDVFYGMTSSQMKIQANFTNLGWDFVNETTNGTNDYWAIRSDINDGFPYLIWADNNWNGSGNWNTSSNWSLGYVDTLTNQINVVTGEMIINQNVTFKNLILYPNAKLTINPGIILTISGNLIIQSDATGTATIIDNGTMLVNGTTTVQQYLTGSGTSTPNGRFWYISSPVTGATSATFDAAGANILKRYDEPTHVWFEIINNTTTLPVGTGYFARLGTTSTPTFTGVLNTGNVNLSLSRTGTTDSKRGFNLVGNPYPSYLDWDAAIKTNVDPTIWYRTNDGVSMVFDTYNAALHVGTNNNGAGTVTKDIPPMQAFWVHVDADGNTGSLTFNNSMRYHRTGNLLKADASNELIRLKVSNGTNSDEAVVVFNADATNAFDAFDSEKMSNNDALIPELYTIANSQKLVINGLESAVSNPIIPLGFKTAKAGIYTISAKSIEGLDGVPVVLEDKLLNISQDLTQTADYSFSSDSVDNASRFVLRLKSTTAVDEIISCINVYAKSQAIAITTTESIGKITVTDVLGRTIATQIIVSTQTEIEVSSGLYFVKVQTNNGVVTKQVVVE
jgi:hypothetical protein